MTTPAVKAQVVAASIGYLESLQYIELLGRPEKWEM
jgi:hypothetical protein